MSLFSAGVLTGLSGREVTDDQATTIETWVTGVLETEIGELPDPVPPGVLAVALELGRGAVPAPGGVGSTTIGPYSATYAGNASTAGLSRSQRLRLLRAVGRGRAFDIDTRPPWWPTPPTPTTTP